MDKIYIGSDHGGFELKKNLVEFLKTRNYDIVDVGPHSFDKDDDYPDFAEKVCEGVRASNGRGIL